MLIKKIKNIFIFIFFLGFLICFTDSKTKEQERNDQIEVDEHIITVFVHGTILPYPSFTALCNTLKGKIKHEVPKGFYKKYLNNMRYEGIYKYQPISGLGLIKIDLNSSNNISCIIAKLYQAVYSNIIKDKKATFSFYTFGWDGSLDQKSRKKWSHRLYNDLQAEIRSVLSSIKAKRIVIELLGHSHGGNLILNLASVEKELNQKLVIDRLVLLGTPIQSETSCFVLSDVFKKVYNLYSRGDIVQVMDIVSTRDSVSARRFKEVASGKLAQVQIKVNEFHPLHNELWFLGKSKNFFYRKKFPIRPYPISIFVPIITDFIEKNIKNSKSEDSVHNNLFLNIKKEKDSLSFVFKNMTILNQDKIACSLAYLRDFY